MSLSVDTPPQLRHAELEIRVYIDPAGELTILFPNGGRRWNYSTPVAAEAAAIDEVRSFAAKTGRTVLMRIEKAQRVSGVTR